MTRARELALYADRPLVAFPRGDWATVLDYGRPGVPTTWYRQLGDSTSCGRNCRFCSSRPRRQTEAEYLRTFVDPRRTTFVYRLNRVVREGRV